MGCTHDEPQQQQQPQRKNQSCENDCFRCLVKVKQETIGVYWVEVLFGFYFYYYVRFNRVMDNIKHH